jgi:triacylglycerol lipase
MPRAAALWLGLVLAGCSSPAVPGEGADAAQHPMPDASAPADAGAGPDASGFEEDPVVFVHGYSGHASDWETMIDRFEAAGYPADLLLAIQLTDNTGSSVEAAAELAAFVEKALARTGAAKVDLVSHSMGALAARLYLARNPGAPVREVVTIAGANHGNAWAFLGSGDGAREMDPAFACQGEALNDVQFELNGCLTDSGRSVAADETPGDHRWLALRTTTDEVISPSESECLNQSRKKDCSDPVNASVSFVSHNGMLGDQGVFDRTLAHVRLGNRAHP